ncbi:azurin [Salinimonas lutimaris]|uniref:azurin n=1 Tax=Salinimonas lutimaris TaxID=914153 RepID=UPI0010C05A4B|nr:azurin [Salinimonas lutimaris]
MLKKLLTASVLLAASQQVFAAECETTIDSTDAMQFDTKEMSVPASCDTFKVTLTHSGKMPKQVMGHNWVLTEEDQAQAVVSDGMTAGLEDDYLKSGDDRVLAATKIIGGGEETSVEFDVATLKEGENYTFFCSFPGHISMMKGTLTVG